MICIALLQLFKQQIHRRLKVLIILPAFASIEHIQQGGHVLFFFRRFIVDVGDKRLIQQGLGLAPEIVPALAFLTLCVLHDNRHQRENVGFTVEIVEGIIVH